MKITIRHLSFEISHSRMRSGFTLIELLISVMIILVVGTIVLVVFFSALRGTERSQKIISLRQNGNFALAQMTKSIRQGKAIVNYNECSTRETNQLIITSSQDLQDTIYTCSEENITAGTTPLLSDHGSIHVSKCSFTCTMQGSTPAVSVYFQLNPVTSDQVKAGDIYDFRNTVLLQNTLAN